MYLFLRYCDIPVQSDGHRDNTFTFNAGLSHAFNEQIQARVSDSFVIGQEPDLLRAGNVFSTFQRVSGNNIRNHGMIALDAQLNPEFGVSVGYDNAFYDYKDRGASIDPTGTVIQPSFAGALHRVENRADIEGAYKAVRETKVPHGSAFPDISCTAAQLS